jgi:hypothetical protein
MYLKVVMLTAIDIYETYFVFGGISLAKAKSHKKHTQQFAYHNTNRNR